MKSLGEFYSRHAGWLRRRLTMRFGSDRADELVQETYLRLAAQNIELVRSPRALLVTIAGNVARDQNRRERVRFVGNAVPVEDAAGAVELAVAPGQVEALLLKEIILGLPDLYRDVFVLSRFAGLTYDEIARRLGLSAKTVEWRMSKALAYCAARLGE